MTHPDTRRGTRHRWRAVFSNVPEHHDTVSSRLENFFQKCIKQVYSNFQDTYF